MAGLTKKLWFFLEFKTLRVLGKHSLIPYLLKKQPLFLWSPKFLFTSQRLTAQGGGSLLWILFPVLISIFISIKRHIVVLFQLCVTKLPLKNGKNMFYFYKDKINIENFMRMKLIFFKFTWFSNIFNLFLILQVKICISSSNL